MEIDPSILKFLLALIIAGIVIEILDRVSSGAAWVVVIIILLGMFIYNPILVGFVTLGSQSLTTSLGGK